MKESDIIHESGQFWVYKDAKNGHYTVFSIQIGLHHSVSDVSYSLDSDGLSLAVARCEYLNKRKVTK